MEGLFPLILVIVVVNVINAVLRAVRGGKGKTDKEVPVPISPPLPERKIKIWADELIDDQAENDHVNRYYNEAVVSAENRELDEPAEERIEEPKPVYHNQPYSMQKNVQTLPGLTGTFRKKDSLLTAFIFHEIIDKPVSKRGKR